MVVEKRLDYGFIGYKVPCTPRATRSARRRRTFTKNIEDNQLSAFDLLATVAGKLLLENESSPTSSNTSTYKDRNSIVKTDVKKEWGDEEPVKVEPGDKGKEFPHPENDVSMGFDDEKLVMGKSRIEIGISCKLRGGLVGYRDSFHCKLEDDIKTQITDGPLETGKMHTGTRSDMCSLEDPDICDRKTAALVSSFGNAKVLPLSRDHIGHSSLPPNRGDVKLVSRDDDENSSGCTHPRTTTRPSRPPQRLGDRRIRRLLASKYWKVTPKYKDQRFCYPGGDMKSVYRNRNNGYKRQRSQRSYPFKKRKFFYQSSVSNSDGGISSVENSKFHEKGINFDASGSDLNKHEASGTSASVACQHPSFQSRNSHVKLRIKSFRVPELFIEIPETATVGSLKRTVVEAVTAILGGGLHVGVLLQGKKLKDDNKTLLQTGISDDNQMDALGFTLEPNTSESPPSLCPGDSPSLLPCDEPRPLTRYPPSSTVINKGSTNSLPKPDVTSMNNFVESDRDSAPSPTDMSIDINTTDSKALVAVQAMSVEALAVVPMHHRFKREIAQRRIRRPFSVSEVEALVQAVEKLGTGRWRDVKLRAFDNAKHRTYVDLKDKWKTLVHTARISPQQRRGEPVPQELLDRVMAAHAYWSQQQAKQQLKQQPDAFFLL